MLLFVVPAAPVHLLTFVNESMQVWERLVPQLLESWDLKGGHCVWLAWLV